MLAACGSGDAGKEAEVAAGSMEAPPPVGPEIRRAAEALPRLYAWIAAQDTAFDPDAFEVFSPLDADTMPARPMPPSELAQWKPYLMYNADSSLAIDLYSYNYVLRRRGGKTTLEEGGPDFEVGLIDLAKGTRRRLFFTGTAASVLDAAWTDSRTVLLAVAEVRSDDGFRPTLHRFNALTGESTLSTYPTVLRGDVAQYPSPGSSPGGRGDSVGDHYGKKQY
ncbi:hypothetical protein GCM10023184_33960 [Flaviaesturariibacter amylovorans]|uniref:Lipoprotein n=2 Tax=Flaviaesturariibacter amylovorans TaxID=1084520 RepID=A0ABP8HEQ3_9BACT